MTRLSQLKGRGVVATDQAATLGRVTDVVIDAQDGVVVALRVDGASRGNTLHWPDIAEFGPDAVMVGSAGAVREATGRAAELGGRDHDVVGKRLLTDAGEELGRVTDVDIDEHSGAVAEIHTRDRSVSGDLLVASGSYAVVVHR